MRAFRNLVAFAVFLVLLASSRHVGGQATPPTAADLFNNQVLQRIDLTMNSRDWEKLKANFLDNEYYTVTIAAYGEVYRNAWVRSRGHGSRSSDKPGLRVDFNKNASGPQEWLGLKSLILDNLTQDASGMREVLSTQFFTRMGLPAMREAFTLLYVNNKFSGLYVVVEPPDKKYLGRVFGADLNGHVENDGYLYEYRWQAPYFLQYLGPDLEQYQVLLEAKTHETESISKLYDPIRLMVREINEARDDLFEANVSAYLNLPVFVKHVALQGFLAERDGLLGYAGLNNFYLYRFEKQTVSQFLLWDADNTFWTIDYPINYGHNENVLMRRTMAIPAHFTAYYNWLIAAAASAQAITEEEALADQKLKIAPRGWLEREIDRYYALIRATMMADTVKPYTNEEFEAAVAYMKQFARERSPYVTCEATKFIDPGKAATVCLGGS